VRLSVVIPTRDRREKLERVLQALRPQLDEVPGGAEVLVVDDGSSDGTGAWLATAGGVRAFRLEGTGPARARNLGAREAAGELLLFLGDDTVPEPRLLALHDAAHREPHHGPRAVLGLTDWDRQRMRVTPLLAHLNAKGAQFGFALIRDAEDVPFNFFYTSNVSLPRDTFLGLGGFDEAFPSAAWEDVELAYRATRTVPPLRIVYRPQARVRHDHPTTLAAARARQAHVGRAAHTLLRKWPELADWVGAGRARGLPRHRPVAVSLLERLIAACDGRGLRLPAAVYDRVLRWDYLDGLRSALEDEPRASGLHFES